MNNIKKLFIVTLILAMVIALSACSGSTNVISSASFDKETIGTQGSSGMTVQIANSDGKTQVIDTEVLKVMVHTPSDQFTVEPIAGSAETLSQPNELMVSLKPGAVLPRDFKFNIAANGAPTGEYVFTVILNAGEDSETSSEVSLTVE